MKYLLLLLIGCNTPPTLERGKPEETALDIVWNQVFNTNNDAPSVHWWYGTCPSSSSARTAVVIEGTCYSGYFVPYNSDVAWRGSYSKSAYAHELMHAWQWTRGISDPDHLNSEWIQVDIANKELGLQGL